ncbi:PAS domain-containing protein [Aestuariispira insulae]|uniref:PAS domain-containing protein n=2 Tax=Aestuariispira insulae TaxID=1461337 RepID=A0A3D9HXP8_9PROT|nr:PAS domain-containing protein [Aestuariispira insulae]
MPSRSDIDPLDIPDLLPGICLLDVEALDRPACKVRFRLAGTRIRDMVGHDVTGKFIDDVFDPPTVEMMAANYQWIAERLEPHYDRRTKQLSEVTTAVYERILAPLGEEGKKPDMFFGMHVVSMQGAQPLNEPLPVG